MKNLDEVLKEAKGLDFDEYEDDNDNEDEYEEVISIEELGLLMNNLLY